jgi:hypothetical protein
MSAKRPLAAAAVDRPNGPCVSIAIVLSCRTIFLSCRFCLAAPFFLRPIAPSTLSDIDMQASAHAHILHGHDVAGTGIHF